MWEPGVHVAGPRVAALAEACARRRVHIAVGVNEREDARPGSLYNSLLLIGPGGLLHRHRELMPTMHERVFHGAGAGDDPDVTELPTVGRVAVLLCWENRMPLARWALYQGGPQIWLAGSSVSRITPSKSKTTARRRRGSVRARPAGPAVGGRNEAEDPRPAPSERQA